MPEDKDLISQQEARDAVEAAYLAFQTVAKFDQAKIDRICEAMAQAALGESARLGSMANEETGFGSRRRQAREKSVRGGRCLELFSRLENRRRHSPDRKRR
jgi:acyl-CoA reductase-like NAD-dependent aldehyde dehydrogenase